MTAPYVPDPVVLTMIQTVLDAYLVEMSLPSDTPIIVLGSASMYIQGIEESFRDLDVLIAELPKDFQKKLIGKDNPAIRLGEGVVVDAFRTGEFVQAGFTTLERDTALTAQGFKVETAECLLTYLKKFNRGTDRARIQAIEAYLAG